MRYYQPTESQFLDDAMYQHPVELMQAAIQANDQRLNTAYDNLGDIDENLKIHEHKKDTDSAREISSKYLSKIDELTKLADEGKVPLPKVNQQIKELSRQLNRDVTDGDIFHINQRNKEIQELKKSLKSQYESSPEKFPQISSKEEIDSYVDSQYQGFKSEEGEYNQAPSTTLHGRDTNLSIIQNVLSQHTGSSFTNRSIDEMGGMLDTQYKGIKIGEINSAIDSFLISDPQIEKSLMQEAEMRTMRGQTTTFQQVKSEYAQELKQLAGEIYKRRLVSRVPTPPKTTGGGGRNPRNPDNLAPKNIDLEILKRNVNFSPDSSVDDVRLSVSNRKQQLSNEIQDQVLEAVKSSNSNFLNANFDFNTGNIVVDGEETNWKDYLRQVYITESGAADRLIDNISDKMNQRFLLQNFSYADDSVIEEVKSNPYFSKDNVWTDSPSGVYDKPFIESVQKAFSAVRPEDTQIDLLNAEAQVKEKLNVVFRRRGETNDQLKQRLKVTDQELQELDVVSIDVSPDVTFVDGDLLVQAIGPQVTRRKTTKESTNNKPAKTGGSRASQYVQGGTQGPSGPEMSEDIVSVEEMPKTKFSGAPLLNKSGIDFESPVALSTLQIGDYSIDAIVNLNSVGGVNQDYLQTVKQNKQLIYPVQSLIDQYPSGLLNENKQAKFQLPNNILQGDGFSLEIDTISRKPRLRYDDGTFRVISEEADLLAIISALLPEF